jgi:hypothetical protein
LRRELKRVEKQNSYLTTNPHIAQGCRSRMGLKNLLFDYTEIAKKGWLNLFLLKVAL